MSQNLKDSNEVFIGGLGKVNGEGNGVNIL